MTTALMSCTADLWGSSIDGLFTGTTNIVMGKSPAFGEVRAYMGFGGIYLPKNFVITAATLRIYSVTTNSQDVFLKIGCDAADNSSTPTTLAELQGKALSAAFSTFDLSSTPYTAGNEYTFDITSAVQETLNRSGWASGNTIGIIIDNNGTDSTKRREAAAIENTSYTEPILQLDYVSFRPRSGGVI